MRVGRVEAFAVRYPEPNNDGKLRSLMPGPGRDRRRARRLGRGDQRRARRSRSRSRSSSSAGSRRSSSARDPRDVTGAWAAMRDATYWDGNGGIVTLRHQRDRHGALGHRRQGRRGSRSARSSAGERRDRLPACASTIFATDDLDRVGREFAGFVADGYRYVKGGWGHDLSIAFGRDEARDLAVARAVREAIGPDVEMIVDVVALAGWDASHAIRMARRARRATCRTVLARGPARRAGPRRLSATPGRGRHPHLHGREGLARGPLPRSHRVRRASTSIMVDPGKAEGVTGTWGVIAMAAAAGLRLERPLLGSALNTAASLHLAVAASEHAHLRAEARALADAARARAATPDRAARTAGSARPTGPASAWRWTRPWCAATGSGRTSGAAEPAAGRRAATRREETPCEAHTPAGAARWRC